MLPDRRKLMWQAMLTAEFRSRYWGIVSIRYERLELSLTILIAAFSLGAVASWLGDLVSGLPPALMAVTGVLSITLALAKFSRRAESSAGLGSRWNQQHYAYSHLWSDLPVLPEEDAWKRFVDLREAERDLYDLGVRLHDSKRLAKKIQSAVLRAHNLNPA